MKRKRNISNSSLMIAIVLALLIGVVMQVVSENTSMGVGGVTKVSAQGVGGDPDPTPPRPQDPTDPFPDPDTDPFPDPFCPDPEEPCPDNDNDIGWIEYIGSFFWD